MNSLEVLASLMAFSSNDWSRNRSDALIYGIVVGWDEASGRELKKRFGIDTGDLALLHEDFQRRARLS